MPPKGYIGVLVLNQGGRNRSEASNRFKRLDLVSHSAHLVICQEFDARLLKPQDHIEWHQVVPKMCWACGCVPALAVRARKSSVKALEMLESHCLNDGREGKQHTSRGPGMTPLMIVRVHWKDELNREPWTLLNIHCHYNTANEVSGYRQGYVRMWDKTAEMIKKHGVDFLAGDMNQALYKAQRELEFRGVRFPVMFYSWWGESEAKCRETNDDHDSMAIYVEKEFSSKIKMTRPKHYRQVNGAHEPLLVYVGNAPIRTQAAKRMRNLKRMSKWMTKLAAKRVVKEEKESSEEETVVFSPKTPYEALESAGALLQQEDTGGASSSTTTWPLLMATSKSRPPSGPKVVSHQMLLSVLGVGYSALLRCFRV